MRKKIGAELIVRSHGKYLLQLRDDFYPNTWCVFGGHQEGYEDYLATLKREIYEELGVDLNYPPYNGFRALGRYENEKTVIGVFLLDGDFTTADFELGEGKGIAFVNPDHIPKLRMTPDEKEIFKKYNLI